MKRKPVRVVHVGRKRPTRFSNARKIDLGDFIMRKLADRDPSLTVDQVRKVCSHLYTRLRTKAGARAFLGQRDIRSIERAVER